MPAGILVVGLWLVLAPPPKAHWKQTLAPDAPVQTADDLPASWNRGQYTFAPLAHYRIKAVVLSKHRYWAGLDEDLLAPYDLALGWGLMSAADTINALNISQGGRWYHYTWKGAPPIDEQEMALGSANNHIIPADRMVGQKIASIRRHDLVDLQGYLVNISRANGWHWNSSQTREDTGSGSCEVFWVNMVHSIRKLQ